MKSWAVLMIAVGFTIMQLPSHMRWMVYEHWYDPEKNLVTIKLTDTATDDPSDSGCERVAKLFHEICKQGYTLKVLPFYKGGWVPSRVNPMDVRWTRYLTGEILKPPEPPETPDP